MNKIRKLNADELDKALSRIPAWHIERGKLYRCFRFDNFIRAFAFMSGVALEAQAMDHHPEWSNVYDTVHIRLTTHDAGGISELDFVLAEKIDALYQP